MAEAEVDVEVDPRVGLETDERGVFSEIWFFCHLHHLISQASSLFGARHTLKNSVTDRGKTFKLERAW